MGYLEKMKAANSLKKLQCSCLQRHNLASKHYVAGCAFDNNDKGYEQFRYNIHHTVLLLNGEGVDLKAVQIST